MELIKLTRNKSSYIHQPGQNKVNYLTNSTATDEANNIYNFYINIPKNLLDYYLKLIETHGSLLSFGICDIAYSPLGVQLDDHLALYVKYKDINDYIDFCEKSLTFVTE